jgi:hypothetical protein
MPLNDNMSLIRRMRRHLSIVRGSVEGGLGGVRPDAPGGGEAETVRAMQEERARETEFQAEHREGDRTHRWRRINMGSKNAADKVGNGRIKFGDLGMMYLFCWSLYLVNMQFGRE